MKPRILSFSLLPLSALLLFQSPLRSQNPPDLPTPAVAGEEGGYTFGYDADESLRMTVPVSIGGMGPYRFMVDTGSERTVIARQLAERLRLGSGRNAQLHSMTEVSDIRTVIIPSLEIGDRTVRDIHAPALEGQYLGAQGILGVDSLQAQRVSFDFTRQEMNVTPSRRRDARWPDDAIVVTARNRFGYLVLVDASAEGQKVWVIIDTGAELTVGNEALRRKLASKGRLPATRPVGMISVTGGRMTADEGIVKRIRIAGVDIQNMPVAFADVHPFRKLELLDRPAILLGMDALRMFERVSVDFANRKVRLLPPRSAMEPMS